MKYIWFLQKTSSQMSKLARCITGSVIARYSINLSGFVASENIGFGPSERVMTSPGNSTEGGKKNKQTEWLRDSRNYRPNLLHRGKIWPFSYSCMQVQIVLPSKAPSVRCGQSRHKTSSQWAHASFQQGGARTNTNRHPPNTSTQIQLRLPLFQFILQKWDRAWLQFSVAALLHAGPTLQNNRLRGGHEAAQ